MSDQLYLSNLKMLRLGSYENTYGPLDVDYIDQVCREIFIEKGPLMKLQTSKEVLKTVEKEEQAQSTRNDVDEVVHVKKKIPIINSFSYIDNPETILSALQVSAQIYAKQHKLLHNEGIPGLPKEVVQVQHLSHLSLWRKETMKRLNEKLKSKTV